METVTLEPKLKEARECTGRAWRGAFQQSSLEAGMGLTGPLGTARRPAQLVRMHRAGVEDEIRSRLLRTLLAITELLGISLREMGHFGGLYSETRCTEQDHCGC